MEKIKQITIEQALNGKRTFYAKRWQQNGFYPIDKYEYRAETDEFEQFDKKISGWHSWGIGKAGEVNNHDWLKYIFEHNSYILSWDEPTDEHHHEDEYDMIRSVVAETTITIKSTNNKYTAFYGDSPISTKTFTNRTEWRHDYREHVAPFGLELSFNVKHAEITDEYTINLDARHIIMSSSGDGIYVIDVDAKKVVILVTFDGYSLKSLNVRVWNKAMDFEDRRPCNTEFKEDSEGLAWKRI